MATREFTSGRRYGAAVVERACGEWELVVRDMGEVVHRSHWGSEEEAVAALRLAGPRGWRELVCAREGA